jgi:HK97 family phage major capsid protein
MLFQKKGEAYHAWREIDQRASKEERSLSAEETSQVATLEKTIEECDKAIQAEQDALDRQRRLAAVGESLRQPVDPLPLPRGSDGAETKTDRRNVAEKLLAYTGEGMSRKEALDRIASERNERATTTFREYLLTGQIRDRAALRMDDDSAGGYLVVPEQFIARLIQDLDRRVVIRQFATIIPVSNAESIGVPTLATDIADTVWTTELEVGTEDSSLSFGKRRLTPHPLAKYILVSKDLLRSAALSVESIVRERMAYKFGTVQETGFMTGSGANSPLGLFTASSAGISTSQDVSTGNTTTAVTADGLINAKYALETQWMNSGSLRWIFHRAIVKMIRKLKDGDGQYLWQPGLVADTTDTLLGIPVVQSEYAPSTATTGLYVGLVGDLSYYWIADNMAMDIQRLVELGALTNQDYFIGRMKLDGMPVLEKAFVRVTLA